MPLARTISLVGPPTDIAICGLCWPRNLERAWWPQAVEFWCADGSTKVRRRPNSPLPMQCYEGPPGLDGACISASSHPCHQPLYRFLAITVLLDVKDIPQ